MTESAKPAAKPKVVASLEDDTGDRCVDVIAHPDGQFSYAECRRDPEDNHGWRRLSQGEGKRYPSQYAAYAAALREVEWLMD